MHGTSFEEGLPRTFGALGGVLGCVLSGYFLMTVIVASEQSNEKKLERICAAFIASLILEAAGGAAVAISGNCAARSFLSLFPRMRQTQTQFLLPSAKFSLGVAAVAGVVTAACVALTAARR